jgi:TolB protein
MSVRAPRTGLVLKGAVLVAAAVTAAGASVALAAPSARPAASASKVPLSKVGLGWSIAEYSNAPLPKEGQKPKPGTTTLYAVSPQGTKYPFYSWSHDEGNLSSYTLVDWSGDKQRVLVANGNGRYEQISLVTGKVINSFKLDPSISPFGYTRPDGENILTSGVDGVGVRRYNLDGQLQKVLSATGFNALESPSGTTVLVEAKYGLEEVSNAGGVVGRLHAPIAVTGCYPTRWWTASTVLAWCNAAHGPSAARLWLFSTSTSKVTALTAQRGNTGPDLGDIDAWKLSSGTYLQALGPCGVEFVAQQWANGSAHQVKLPGVNYPSFHVVTGHGSSLLVQAENGCSAGASLVWFNPHTKKVSWVFRTPKNVSGLQLAIPYGRPLS